jgi:excisionase family DNA binding protein
MLTRVRISSSELAAALGVTREHVSRLVARGEIPLLRAPRQGRRYELDARVLDALLESAGRRVVKVAPWIWAQVVAQLPAVRPETLHTEIAGALRAAAAIGGVGRRKVTRED